MVIKMAKDKESVRDSTDNIQIVQCSHMTDLPIFSFIDPTNKMVRLGILAYTLATPQ